MAVMVGQPRVLYRLPEQRRFGAGSMPTLITMVLGAIVLFLGGQVVGRATMARDPAVTAAPATTAGAAAANYTRVLSSALILDTAQRQAAIDTLAAPEARARLQKTFDQAVASIRAGLGMRGAAADRAQVLLRATPLGWRVEQYGKGSARVGQGRHLGDQRRRVAGRGERHGPRPRGLGTTTVTLRWVDGDWKQVASTTADGPVPIADVAPRRPPASWSARPMSSRSSPMHQDRRRTWARAVLLLLVVAGCWWWWPPRPPWPRPSPPTPGRAPSPSTQARSTARPSRPMSTLSLHYTTRTWEWPPPWRATAGRTSS
jgi:hypothetical protein